jgi:predicted PurR-regulated permease PerM
MGPNSPPRTDSAYADLKYGWRKYGAIVLAAVVCLIFLVCVRSVLPPFIIAFLLALFLNPIVRWMERRGIPRRRSVILIYILGLVVVAALIAWLVPKLVDQSLRLGQSLGGLFGEAKEHARWLSENWRKPFLKLKVPASLLDAAEASAAKVPVLLSKKISTIGVYFAGLAAALGKAILWVIIILVVTAYLVVDIDKISTKMLSLMAPARRESAKRLSANLGGVLAGYLRGVVIVSILYGICATLIFVFTGTRYALVMGLVGGILYIVPYAGPTITALLAFVVAYVSHGGNFLSALFIAGGLMAMNSILFDNFITPRIVGGSVGLHPIVSIFAMLCGVTLFGLWGMILAVPLAGMIQVILLHTFPQLAEKSLIRAPAMRPEPTHAAAPLAQVLTEEARQAERRPRPRPSRRRWRRRRRPKDSAGGSGERRE